MSLPRQSSSKLWHSESTQKALTRHYLERVDNGSARGRDGITIDVFKRRLRSEIKDLSNALRGGEYSFSPYLLVLKLKGPGKPPREISIATVRDRVALRALASVLGKLYSFCSSELAQSKVAKVIAEIKGEQFNYFLKLDVKEFYPSVNHAWLEEVLQRKIPSRKLRTLLMSAVKTPSLFASESSKNKSNLRGIPQGLAVSNALAELSVAHLDEAMTQIDDTAYFRYVDDILVLMKSDQSREIAAKVEALLGPVGLKIHELTEDGSGKSRSGEIQDGFEFLGYRFLYPRVSVRHGSISTLESRIARTFTRHKYIASQHPSSDAWQRQCLARLQWHLDLIITGCVLEGQRYGWLAYFSQIRHQQLLEHLDWLVNKQMRRFKIQGFKPKTFVKSYRFAASRVDDVSGYVPNFDAMNVEVKRTIMIEIFGWQRSTVNSYSDEEAELRFRKKIKRVTSELEQDISTTS